MGNVHREGITLEKRDRIVFELVEGDHEFEPADDDRGGQGGAGGQGGPPRSGRGEVLRDLGSAAVSGMVRARGWVSRHRTVSLIATGVAAAVVLSTAAVGTVRERERIEPLRTAPGGVASLAGPPVEDWRYVPDGATSLVNGYWHGASAVTMGGNVVFLEGEPRPPDDADFEAMYLHMRWDDADLVAVDAGTGRESWRVPLGVDPVCTSPEAGGATHILDEIVCLVGPADERGVVAVTADGQASQVRRLAPGDAGPEVIPAWDGLIVRAHLRGDVPEIDCSGAPEPPEGCVVVGKVSDDRAIVVSAEDARTGDEVWREELPWDGDLGGCIQGYGEGPDPTVDIDTEAVSVGTWGAVVNVSGCGGIASFRADGTRLPGNAFLSGGGTGDLVIVEHFDRNEFRVSVRTTDGDVLLTTDGWVMEGRVTDGTPSDILVTAPGELGVLRAYHRDGSPAWESDESAHEMLARVGNIGIFSRSPGTSVGIDLRTGHHLWEWNGEDVGFDRLQEAAETSFTDGRSVMLVKASTYGTTTLDEDGRMVTDMGEIHLAAVDVETGRTRWHMEHEDLSWFAADGRLLSITADGSLVGHRG